MYLYNQDHPNPIKISVVSVRVRVRIRVTIGVKVRVKFQAVHPRANYPSHGTTPELSLDHSPVGSQGRHAQVRHFQAGRERQTARGPPTVGSGPRS